MVSAGPVSVLGIRTLSSSLDKWSLITDELQQGPAPMIQAMTPATDTETIFSHETLD